MACSTYCSSYFYSNCYYHFLRCYLLALLLLLLLSSTACRSQTSRPKGKAPLNKMCKCPGSNQWETQVTVEIIALAGRAYSYNCYQDQLRYCKSMSIGLAADIDDLHSSSDYYVRECEFSTDEAAELRRFNVSYEGQCVKNSSFVNVTVLVQPAIQTNRTPACRTNCFFYLPKLYVFEPGEMRMTATYSDGQQLRITEHSKYLDVRSKATSSKQKEKNQNENEMEKEKESKLRVSCDLAQCAGAPSRFDWKINGKSISAASASEEQQLPIVMQSSGAECSVKRYGDERDKLITDVASRSNRDSFVEMDLNQLALHEVCRSPTADDLYLSSASASASGSTTKSSWLLLPSTALPTRSFLLQCSHYLLINRTLHLAADSSVRIICPTYVAKEMTTRTMAAVTEAIEPGSASFIQKNLVAICVGAIVLLLIVIAISVAIHRRCSNKQSEEVDDANSNTGFKLTGKSKHGDSNKPSHKNARVTFAHVEVLDSAASPLGDFAPMPFASPTFPLANTHNGHNASNGGGVIENHGYLVNNNHNGNGYHHHNNNNNNNNHTYFKVPVITSV